MNATKINAYKSKFTRQLFFISFLIISLGFISGNFYTSVLAYEQTSSTDGLNSTILVTGSATTTAKSDRVIVSLGVETTNTTAEEALFSNSNIMNAVINAIKNAGAQENELSTSSFTITPNYNYSQYGTRGNLTDFTVSNSIQIDSNNIGQVSKWIDVGVSAGANNINNIFFSLSEQKLEDIKNNLLKQAVANAKLKAEIVSSAAGLNLTGIKSITVGGLGMPPPIMPYPSPSLAAKSIGSEAYSVTPVLEGQQEVSVSVTIVYFSSR